MMGKKWHLIAGIALLAGIGLFVAGMIGLDWDYTKLSTMEFVTNTYEISEAISDISVDAGISDITFGVSGDGKCRVICTEAKNAKHRVYADSGVLKVQLVDERAWYEHIGIFFGGMKITILLPQGQYGALSVKTQTGDVDIPADFYFEQMKISVSTGEIRCRASAMEDITLKTVTGAIYVENISAKSISASVSTGKTSLKDISCRSLLSEGSTGGAYLENVIATECLSVERTTGDVRLSRCDAPKIRIETNTGDVIGTLLSDKEFATHTNTGDVDVPDSTSGGECWISTNTGDIEMAIEK